MTPFGLFGALHQRRHSHASGNPSGLGARVCMLHRWLKFNFVGAVGVVVQLGAVVMFRRALRFGDLWATALAVEISLLHNFLWHERFTWADPARQKSCKPVLMRLVRFNLTNGAISVAGNLVVVWCLRGVTSLPLVAANLMAISCTGILNFVVCQRVVFQASAPTFTNWGGTLWPPVTRSRLQADKHSKALPRRGFR
ncbi:MAG: GtrA family protein [Terriglobia bacterium]